MDKVVSISNYKKNKEKDLKKITKSKEKIGILEDVHLTHNQSGCFHLLNKVMDELPSNIFIFTWSDDNIVTDYYSNIHDEEKIKEKLQEFIDLETEASKL